MDKCEKCGNGGLIIKEGQYFKMVTWMGLCYECWKKTKYCDKCFPGKGDGNHAPEHHLELVGFVQN